MSVEIKFMTTTVKYTWQDNKTNENIYQNSKLTQLQRKFRITEINGYNTLSKWTEQTTAISTMSEMKLRTPQKTSSLLMALEQVIRPKPLQAI
jgi:hypothetical protein